VTFIPIFPYPHSAHRANIHHPNSFERKQFDSIKQCKRAKIVEYLWIWWKFRGRLQFVYSMSKGRGFWDITHNVLFWLEYLERDLYWRKMKEVWTFWTSLIVEHVKLKITTTNSIYSNITYNCDSTQSWSSQGHTNYGNS